MIGSLSQERGSKERASPSDLSASDIKGHRIKEEGASQGAKKTGPYTPEKEKRAPVINTFGKQYPTGNGPQEKLQPTNKKSRAPRQRSAAVPGPHRSTKKKHLSFSIET